MNGNLRFIVTVIFVFMRLEGVCVNPISQSVQSAYSSRGIAFSPVIDTKCFCAVTTIGPNKLTIYSVNTYTAEFSRLAAYDVGNWPAQVSFSPRLNNKLFVAVANFTGNISIFSLDITTGICTPVSGSPFFSLNTAYGISFSPLVNGKLYAAIVSLFAHQVMICSVDIDSGNFTAIGQPVNTGTYPIDVKFSEAIQDSVFLAVADSGDNTIHVYHIEMSTGALTLVDTAQTGNLPISVAFSPNCNGNLFAAVTNNGDDTVGIYSVDPASGKFTQLPNSPIQTERNPTAISFSPIYNNQLFAAITCFSSNSVQIFAIDQSSGLFSQLPASPFKAGISPFVIACSPILNNILSFAAAPLPNDISQVGIADADMPTVYALCFAPQLLTVERTGASGLLMVTGTGAYPGAIITILSDSTSQIGSGIADSFGNFTISTVVQIARGSHAITAQQLIAGCTSEQSQAIMVVRPLRNVYGSALAQAIMNKYLPVS